MPRPFEAWQVVGAEHSETLIARSNLGMLLKLGSKGLSTSKPPEKAAGADLEAHG